MKTIVFWLSSLFPAVVYSLENCNLQCTFTGSINADTFLGASQLNKTKIALESAVAGFFFLAPRDVQFISAVDGKNNVVATLMVASSESNATTMQTAVAQEQTHLNYLDDSFLTDAFGPMGLAANVNLVALSLSCPTSSPSFSPSFPTTFPPSGAPTISPTASPTATKTTPPTASKTAAPTIANTQNPTEEPTPLPTVASTVAPQQNVVVIGPYLDETCMLLAPESESKFPFMGICIDTDTCVNVYNNQPDLFGGSAFNAASFKLTETTSFTQAYGTTHQINVTFYNDVTRYESLTPGGCKNSTQLPLAVYLGEEPLPPDMHLANYNFVLLELAPGKDGDCVQAAGLPYTFKFAHEACIPYAYDISSEPTLQPTKRHPTPMPTVFPTANNVYLQIQQFQDPLDCKMNLIYVSLSCVVVGQCFEVAGGVWSLIELSLVDSSSGEVEVRAATFSDSQCAVPAPAPPNYPGVTPTAAGMKFIPGMCTGPTHYSQVYNILRIREANALNTSIVDECEVGSFLIGPQPTSTVLPTSAPTSSPTLQFTYAIVYQRSVFDDDFDDDDDDFDDDDDDFDDDDDDVDDSVNNLYDYENCVELNECLEYLTGEVWLKAEVAPNPNSAYSIYTGVYLYTYSVTYYKDGLCTQKKKTHTLDDFVPGGVYINRPWVKVRKSGWRKEIKIDLTNECPYGVNILGQLNDDDDVLSDDGSDDGATTNDDNGRWWASNPFSSTYESDSESDIYESFNGPILTVGILLGLLSMGVVIFVKRRANVWKGYTPIGSDTSTTVEVVEAPRLGIDKKVFMI